MHRLLVVVLALLAVSSDAAAQTQPSFGDALKVAAVSAPLTPEERALAAKLTEQALRSASLWTTTKMYLVEALPQRDSAAEAAGTYERMARLTFYRYDGALTIAVVVNLARQQVTAVNRLPNFEPPFSAEEYALARTLVFADPQVSEALAPFRDRVIVEPITSRHDSPADPLFRHRVVYFFFHVGPRYVPHDRLVLVDLTTQTVILQPVSNTPAHVSPSSTGGR
jgi:Cu2+-containing amine oxidase